MARGNLWFGEFAGLGKLATFDYRSAKITEFPTPTKYSGAYSVSVDSHHNLIWVNEMMADQIARLTRALELSWNTGFQLEIPW